MYTHVRSIHSGLPFKIVNFKTSVIFSFDYAYRLICLKLMWNNVFDLPMVLQPFKGFSLSI